MARHNIYVIRKSLLVGSNVLKCQIFARWMGFKKSFWRYNIHNQMKFALKMQSEQFNDRLTCMWIFFFIPKHIYTTFKLFSIHLSNVFHRRKPLSCFAYMYQKTQSMSRGICVKMVGVWRTKYKQREEMYINGKKIFLLGELIFRGAF